jgi:hypothetical protein
MSTSTTHTGRTFHANREVLKIRRNAVRNRRFGPTVLRVVPAKQGWALNFDAAGVDLSTPGIRPQTSESIAESWLILPSPAVPSRSRRALISLAVRHVRRSELSLKAAKGLTSRLKVN